MGDGSVFTAVTKNALESFFLLKKFVIAFHLLHTLLRMEARGAETNGH